MDQNYTPVLDAIERIRQEGIYPFSLPGHRFGRGIGRIAAEMISPYPPGVPAILPGERFNQAVVTYLRAGKAAGMTIPDASDPELETFRVVSGLSRTQPSSR